MSSITIYLDDELELRLRQTATREGLSVSKLVAKMVEDRTSPSWPEEFLSLAGAWADTDISRPSFANDSARESL